MAAAQNGTPVKGVHSQPNGRPNGQLTKPASRKSSAATRSWSTAIVSNVARQVSWWFLLAGAELTG